jgi:ABC-type taurine transport system ATPase subunit
MVFQKPTPFPTMSIYDNVVAGLKLVGIRDRALLDEVAERSLRQAALWDEVKDRLKAPASGHLRRAAAAALDRAGAGRRGRGAADGRAHLLSTRSRRCGSRS